MGNFWIKIAGRRLKMIWVGKKVKLFETVLIKSLKVLVSAKIK